MIKNSYRVYGSSIIPVIVLNWSFYGTFIHLLNDKFVCISFFVVLSFVSVSIFIYDLTCSWKCIKHNILCQFYVIDTYFFSLCLLYNFVQRYFLFHLPLPRFKLTFYPFFEAVGSLVSIY